MTLSQIRAKEQARKQPIQPQTQPTWPQPASREYEERHDMPSSSPTPSLNPNHSPLNTTLKSFCLHFSQFRNASAAARYIGVSDSSSRVTGHRLLQRDNIQSYIKELTGFTHQHIGESTDLYTKAEKLILYAVDNIEDCPGLCSFYLRSAKMLMQLASHRQTSLQKEEKREGRKERKAKPGQPKEEKRPNESTGQNEGSEAKEIKKEEPETKSTKSTQTHDNQLDTPPKEDVNTQEFVNTFPDVLTPRSTLNTTPSVPERSRREPSRRGTPLITHHSTLPPNS